MTSRERVIAALEHKEVDRFPRNLWALPNVGIFKPDNLRIMEEKFPGDVGGPNLRFGTSKYAKGEFFRLGKYTDEFGCEWEVTEDGVTGEIKKPIFADFDELDHYLMPYELLDEADFSKVNESCKNSDRFMLCGTHIRPFERMQFMRGTENVFMDLAMEEPKLYELSRMLHDFDMKELEMLCDTDIDGVFFMDDWGTQISLLISPEKWREFFKPLYKDFCDLAHSKGKYVFFHSDGNIEAIYPDLIEVGINAVNSQLFCMNIEELAEKYGSQIAFWGEIDRQHILPFGTTDDVKAAVDRVSGAVIKGNGGVRTGAFAQCEYNVFDKFENILTVFERWSEK